MKKKLHVTVNKEHIKKLTSSRSAYDPIYELIWNSLDADATEIDISVNVNNLDSVDRIVVTDNGDGLIKDKAEIYFGDFGNNHKETEYKSNANRIFHGQKGYGRYKVFSICGYAEWNFLSMDESYKILLTRQDLENVEIEETTDQNSQKTTTVILEDFDAKPASTLADLENLQSHIAAAFCIYFRSYSGIKISLNSVPIDISKYILNEYSESCDKHIEGKLRKFETTVIETLNKVDNNLYFCTEDGVVLDKKKCSYNPPFNFVCYILSSYLTQLSEANLLNTDLSKDFEIVIDMAIDFMKKVARGRRAQLAQSLISELKSQNVYPYGPTNDQIEETEKDVFDIVINEINTTSNLFNNMNKQNKKVTLRLMKEAISHTPSEFFRILKEVFELNDSDLNKFIELIDEISLKHIINLSTTINDRIKALEAFRLFMSDKDLKKKVKERSQLHKFLIRHLWILGDQYSYGTDDQTLYNVLLRHLDILGRDKNEIEPALIEKMDDIPDIFIYQKYPDNIDPNRCKNLIIEIKRPSNVANKKEIDQIESYANAVMNEALFQSESISWEFILITTEYHKDILHKVNQRDRVKGVTEVGDGHTIRVAQWSDILQACDGRLQFLKQNLNRSYNKDEVVSHLRNQYPFFASL